MHGFLHSLIIIMMTIQRLDGDCLFAIFNNLSFADKLHCTLVCHKWKDLMYSDVILWKSTEGIGQVQEIIKHYLSTYYECNSLTRKHFCECSILALEANGCVTSRSRLTLCNRADITLIEFKYEDGELMEWLYLAGITPTASLMQNYYQYLASDLKHLLLQNHIQHMKKHRQICGCKLSVDYHRCEEYCRIVGKMSPLRYRPNMLFYLA